MATPFVQGRLRGTPLTVRIDSACSWCERAVAIDVDERLESRVTAGGDSLLLFEPEIDWARFAAPTIVHDY